MSPRWEAVRNDYADHHGHDHRNDIEHAGGMAEDEHHQHHDRDQQLQPPLTVTGYTFNTGG